MSAVLVLSFTAACGEALEPTRVTVPVETQRSAFRSATTDLGYHIQLDEVRVVVGDITFAIAGEAHVLSWLNKLSEALIPSARAHPGHLTHGDVVGQLLGRHVLRWPARTSLGDATLLPGRYRSANLVFGHGDADLGLDPEDPLLEHTAMLQGTAVRDGVTIPFRALIDAPQGRELNGIPCDVEIDGQRSVMLVIELLVRDPIEGDTLFDGIDFAALQTDAAPIVHLSAESTDDTLQAYYQLRRRLLSHDHFMVVEKQLVAP